jgi:REP element-mobilizing transposase RayT
VPLYHFTLHAYRSWNADHPKGYIQRGELGIKPPDAKRAKQRNYLAKHPAFLFDEADQQFLIGAVRQAAARRKWEVYGGVVIPTHMHAVVGWQIVNLHPDAAQALLKRSLGFLLAQRHGTQGKPYFSRGGEPERVKDTKHLAWLLDSYFPRHKGAYWKRPNMILKPREPEM